MSKIDMSKREGGGEGRNWRELINQSEQFLSLKKKILEN